MKKYAVWVLIFVVCFELSACAIEETADEAANYPMPARSQGTNDDELHTQSPEPMEEETLTPQYWLILSFQSGTLRPASSDEEYSFELLQSSQTTSPFSMASLQTTSLGSNVYEVGNAIDLEFTTYIRNGSNFYSHGAASAVGTVISESNGIMSVVATLLVPFSLPVDIQIVYQAVY